MEQIYKKIKKVVIELSKRYNININSFATFKKPKIRKIFPKNKEKNEEINSTEYIKEEKEKEKKENKEKKEETIQNQEIKEFLLEQPQKIIEFKENLANISNNINMNLTLNMFENMTFFKNNSGLKETILSIASNEMKKKNSFLKHSLLSNSNKKNKTPRSRKSKNFQKSKNSDKSRKSIIKIKKIKTSCKEYEKENLLINPYIKLKTLKINENLDNIGKKSQIDKNKTSKRSSLNSHYFISNLSQMINDINNSSLSDSSEIYKKLLPKKEKVHPTTFTNLITTQEKSFQLNSSYDNINTISNNKYIKRECMEGKFLKKKSTFLQIPNFSNISNFTPKNKIKKINSVSNEIDSVKFCYFQPRFSHATQMIINENRVNTSTNRKLYKSPTVEGTKTEEQKKREILNSLNKLYDLKKDKIMNIYDPKKLNTPVLEPRRLKSKNTKTKKKPERISKQLSIISKNIENTSKNINNPGEFYMNFFNNIIAKESKTMNGEENRDKLNSSKILKNYSTSKLRETRISKGKNSMEQSLYDSFISLRENKRKDSFNKTKTKHKSAFKH